MSIKFLISSLLLFTATLAMADSTDSKIDAMIKNGFIDDKTGRPITLNSNLKEALHAGIAASLQMTCAEYLQNKANVDFTKNRTTKELKALAELCR